MGVPPPNLILGPDGLPLVRFYVKEDPVYADVDNRPLSDLAERDRLIQQSLVDESEALQKFAEKIGEDTTTAKGTPPAGPPDYGNNYVVEDGETHTEAIGDLSAESERVKTFIGKDDLAQSLPDYSPYTTHNFITPNAPLEQAIGELDDALARYALGVGMVVWFAANEPPEGMLVCNGAGLDVSLYADLFSVLGYTFGGSGSTFNLPDLRGVFIRGWDAGRGYDPGRVFGSEQSDELKSHSHNYSTIWGNYTGWASGANHRWEDSTLSTAATGGTETRPKNVALLPCIKY